MQRSKTYRKAAEQVDRDQLYTPLEAIKLAKETTSTKFDATVEVAMRLGVDPRKADQMVRGMVNLPHGTGKTARVIVFAAGDKAAEAEAAGADEVGTDELVARIQGGWLDFDAAIATPDQMAKIGRIARILGPRGLMPNPKTGTVTMDVTKAVADIKGGKITFRVDKHSNLHLIIGKASFYTEKLIDNYARRARRGAAGQAVRGQGQVPQEVTSPPPWARASRSTRTSPATCWSTTPDPFDPHAEPHPPTGVRLASFAGCYASRPAPTSTGSGSAGAPRASPPRCG